MKDICILLIVMVTAIIVIGCDKPTHGGIYDVHVDIRSADLIPGGDTCALYYRVGFRDPADNADHFYYAYLMQHNGTDYVIGRPVYFPDTSGFMYVDISVHRFDHASPGLYELEVRQCDSLNSRGMPMGYNDHGVAMAMEYLPTFVAGCDSCYCTDTATTPVSRWYVSAAKSVNDVEAVTAEIKTVGSRGLCGLGCGDTTAAFSNMHVNVSNTATGLWGQAGLITERLIGTTITYTRSYFEAKLSEYHQPVTWYAPTDPATDSWHTHEVLVDTALGRIRWIYDNDTLINVRDSTLILPLGNSVSCTGEVYPRESDMPGVWSSRCISRYIGYRPSGGQGYNNIWFSSNDVENDDPTEFGIERKDNGNTIEIWDYNPLQ